MRGLTISLPAALTLAAILAAASAAAQPPALYTGLNGWAYEAVEAAAAPAATSAVKVAIIDTGVDTKRIDPALIEPGKNSVFDGADTEDLNGHGTRVASLIAGCADASENEDGGLPPLAANARIVPLVYYSQYPSGVPKSGGVKAISQAIYDAIDLYGCRVINISSGAVTPDDGLAAAVEYAEKHGVIVVAAAGNGNLNSPEQLYYPAAYDTVVGVGAVGKNLEPSAFSERNDVTVYAPGENLSAASIRNGKAFDTVSGTSYSVAFVTALAASMLGEYPNMTPAEFRAVLENSATAIGPDGGDKNAGLVNFKNAFDYYEKRNGHKK